jgi:hypothetical protein
MQRRARFGVGDGIVRIVRIVQIVRMVPRTRVSDRMHDLSPFYRACRAAFEGGSDSARISFFASGRILGSAVSKIQYVIAVFR